MVKRMEMQPFKGSACLLRRLRRVSFSGRASSEQATAKMRFIVVSAQLEAEVAALDDEDQQFSACQVSTKRHFGPEVTA